MEKFKLNNGVTVVCANCASCGLSVSVTVNVGHVNEPKLGIAALYEKVLVSQISRVQTVYGGTITSFITGCDENGLESVIANLAKLFTQPLLSDDIIHAAAYDIVQHTRDMAPLVERQMKLLYKHTAFAKKRLVWEADSYIQALESYTADDLKEFADKYYTGKNLVLVVAGAHVDKAELKQLAEKYFGNVSEGERQRTQKHLYTGGCNSMQSSGECEQIMLGWDVTDIKSSPDANVMMSLLAGRLERSFNEIPDPENPERKIHRPSDAKIVVKIAGYYGCRTLRVSVISSQFSANEMLDLVCADVKRLCETEASDRRMEVSRNRAMSEKLFLFSQPQDAAVETAWQLFGRGEMYDVNARINYIWGVTAHDIRMVAQEIFAKPLTMVVYTNEPHYSYEEVKAKF